MIVNLIPMAGSGKRFEEKGYKVPKPLIDISGKPMIIQAISLMPKADKWIFICKNELVNKYHVDKTLRETLGDTKIEIVPIDYNTQGQICTCLLAEKFIKPEEPLFIGACDYGAIWDKKEYQKLLNEEDSDVICWSFTKHKGLVEKPNAWGWLKVSNDKKIMTGVSVKKPVSINMFNDFAIVGSFYFKKGKIFLETAKEIIKNNERVNNEFYVDSCMGKAVELGYKVKNFVVDEFICWGSPEDVEEYKLNKKKLPK